MSDRKRVLILCNGNSARSIFLSRHDLDGLHVRPGTPALTFQDSSEAFSAPPSSRGR